MNRQMNTGQRMAAIFQAHGLDSATRAPMVLAQELALAVTLQGRYAASFRYQSQLHEVHVAVFEPANAQEALGESWWPDQRWSVALPTRHTDAEGRRFIQGELARITEGLSELLQEGQPS